METFRFWFNRRRNFVTVHFDASTPKTLDRKGYGLWGYYLKEENRSRWGKFGELHFITRTGKLRDDVISHELFHLLADYLRYRSLELNEQNEERIVLIHDELTRSFWREYKKLQ